MFYYHAPDPYENKSYSSLRSFSSSRSLGKIEMPPEWLAPINYTSKTLAQFAENHHVKIQGGYITTHDGATIDTIEIKPANEDEKPINEQTYLIKFNGNRTQYQDVLTDYADDAIRLNIIVIGFNYRGVGNSKNATDRFQDLVTDGIAQVQRLLNNGVSSNKITLDGLSLGAGVATMVAAHFHRLNQPVYLWNDRSFSLISKLTAGIIAPESKSIFSRPVRASLQLTSFSLISPAGWEENIAQAYKSIPVNYKGYMYVAKKSDKSFGDGVIDHPVSLHKGVKQFEKEKYINTGHKFYAQSRKFRYGHNMPRTDLISVKDTQSSSQDIFDSFMNNHK